MSDSIGNMKKLFSRKAALAFTVTELLIALFMAALVISAGMKLYMTQHNQLLVQEDVSEIQGNARSVAAMLAKEIRNAGYLLPPTASSLAETNSNPETLIVKYGTPRLNGVILGSAMLARDADLRCAGNTLDSLRSGDLAYIFDKSANVGEAFVVTQVDYHANTIQHNLSQLSRLYPIGSRICSYTGNKFYIDRSDSTSPNLMVQRFGQNPEVFANNIDFLAFDYVLLNGSVTSVLVHPDSVRMVDIRIRAKTSKPELNNTVEGHNRMRYFSLKVKLRNFGLS